MKNFILNFKAFYPHYIKAHNHPKNIQLHFVGATLFFAFLILFLVIKMVSFLMLAVIAGYFFPHLGHKYFQKNNSMRTSHPVFCVIGAFFLYISTWKRLVFVKKV